MLAALWIPKPDEVPVDLYVNDPGFYCGEVNGRRFCWEQESGKVVRCWFSDEDDSWLLFEVINKLPEPMKDQTNRAYTTLQEDVSEYINRSIN